MYLPPPSSLPPGSIVDSYRRDSGGMRQEQSTDQQLKQIQDYCVQYNLVLRHNFVDEAKSGGSTIGRDDFNRMVDLYRHEEQRPAALILWNYARFARDFDNSIYYKALLRTYKIVVHSINDPIPEGDYGRIVELFIDLSNEEKRRQTSADAKRGLRELVEKYHCVPGVPPRGFKREQVTIGQHRDNSPRVAHRWIPDPEFIPRIKQAFKLKAAGASLAQIHEQTAIFKALNSYQTFFANKLYIGILEFGDLTILDYCPPIVDLPTWDAVQAILALHADRQNVSHSELHPRRRQRVATYLLSGLAYCAQCESPLYGLTSPQRNGSNYTRYACNRKHRRRDCDLKPVPAKQLELEVINKLSAFFDDPANLQALLEEDLATAASFAEENAAQTKAIRKQLTTLRKSIANITEAIAERGKSKSLLEKLTALEAKETKLQSQLQTALTHTPEPPEPLTLEEIQAYSLIFADRLRSQDPAVIRAILHAIIYQVVVNRNADQVHALLILHAAQDPEPPEETNTVSIKRDTLGAPHHTRSIMLEFAVRPKGRPGQ